MGQYRITITGSGGHHNEWQPSDANRLAAGFVRHLKDKGHTVHAATFESGANQVDDLTAETTNQNATAVPVTIPCGEIEDPAPSTGPSTADPLEPTIDPADESAAPEMTSADLAASDVAQPDTSDLATAPTIVITGGM